MISYKAPVIILIANLFFTVSFSLVTYLSSVVPTETIMLFRFLAGPAFLIPYFLSLKKKLVIHSYRLFAFRIFFGISAMSCLFLSFKYGQIGKSMLIFECSALWTLLLSYFIYKHKPHVYSLLCVPFVFLGLFLVIQPTETTSINLGDLFALLGSFLNTGVYLSLKALRHHHDTPTIVLITYFFSALIVGIPSFIAPPILTLELFGLFCLMCTVGFVGQLLMTQGFKYASAGICSLLMLGIVPLTSISGFLFFNEYYDATIWLGIILIFISLGIISRWQ